MMQNRSDTDKNFTFQVVHLITFQVDESGVQMNTDNALKQLRNMSSSGNIWVIKCMFVLSKLHLLILDDASKDELERIPYDSLLNPTYVENPNSNDSLNNLILLQTMAVRAPLNPKLSRSGAISTRSNMPTMATMEMHIFRSLYVSAKMIVDAIIDIKQGRYETENAMNSYLPQSFNSYRGMSNVSVTSEVSGFYHFKNANDDYADKMASLSIDNIHLTAKKSMTNTNNMASYETQRVDNAVVLLNRCFQTIEAFVARLNMVKNARVQLEQRKTKQKRKSASQVATEGMLTLRARQPPPEDFAEIYKKLKLCFNLLARLKDVIDKPNATELVRFLFTVIRVMYSHNKALPAKVTSPLLTKNAVHLIKKSLHQSKDFDLYHDLGTAWIRPANEWKEYIPPYIPIFWDGYQPLLTDLEESDTTSTTVPSNLPKKRSNSSNKSSGSRSTSIMPIDALYALEQKGEGDYVNPEMRRGQVFHRPKSQSEISSQSDFRYETGGGHIYTRASHLAYQSSNNRYNEQYNSRLSSSGSFGTVDKGAVSPRRYHQDAGNGKQESGEYYGKQSMNRGDRRNEAFNDQASGRQVTQFYNQNYRASAPPDPIYPDYQSHIHPNTIVTATSSFGNYDNSMISPVIQSRGMMTSSEQQQTVNIHNGNMNYHDYNNNSNVINNHYQQHGTQQNKDWSYQQTQFQQHVISLGGKLFKSKFSRKGATNKELDMDEGELFELLDKPGNWWKMKNCHQQIGFCPFNFLEPVYGSSELSNHNNNFITSHNNLYPQNNNNNNNLKELNNNGYSGAVNKSYEFRASKNIDSLDGNNPMEHLSNPNVLPFATGQTTIDAYNEATRNSIINNHDTDKRILMQKPTEQQKDLTNELKYLLGTTENDPSLYVPAKNKVMIPRVKAVDIQENSDPQVVQQWLLSKGFKPPILSQFAHIPANELLELTQQELEQFLDKADAIKMDRLLTVQRKKAGYVRRSEIELKAVLDKRKQQAD